MDCPRIDHFVKLHPPYLGGTVRLCCHMTNPPSFKDYEAMMGSDWVKSVRDTFKDNKFPKECIRCKVSEDANQHSIRLSAIEEHTKQYKSDYLVADIMLDNLCNLGCQFCSPMASSKIGAIISPSKYIIHDNTSHFEKLPLDRITQLDLAGGEPSYSKNIKNLLLNLPPNVNSLRINTNCTSYMDEIIPLLDKGFNISITISFDGVNKVQEYIRWPIKWDKFCSILNQYKELQLNYSNLNLSFWTTINAFNINDFTNIKSFSETMNIPLSYSLLQSPEPLNIKYKNHLTVKAKENIAVNDIFNSQLANDIDNQASLNNFITKQDSLRKIRISDYIN